MNAALVFWLGLGVVAYAYLGYPILVRALAGRRGTLPSCDAADVALTVVVAARNEQAHVGDRVRDILAQDYPAHLLRVVVVSDGSDDRTAQQAAIDDPRVRVVELPGNVGKAAALNAGVQQVDTPLVGFTDVRQRFAPNALRNLVAPFADPAVGAVSGELVIRATRASRPATPDPSRTSAADAGSSDPPAHEPAAHGAGLYWRLEKNLRADEARLGWLHGVSGSIHAMRRPLFHPLPAGTVLDDVWLPMHVRLRGYRVWMARDAVALDRASANPGEEFQRKLRTLAGNWQLLVRLPVLLDPFRNPVFFAWASHKLLRLLVPWALLCVLVASALAPGSLYRVALIGQLLAYALAAIGWLLPRLAARVPWLTAAATFLMLNTAALFALPASVAWDPSNLWKKH